MRSHVQVCDPGGGEPNRETSASTGYTLKRWRIIQMNVKRSTTNLFNVTDVTDAELLELRERTTRQRELPVLDAATQPRTSGNWWCTCGHCEALVAVCCTV